MINEMSKFISMFININNFFTGQAGVKEFCEA